MTRNQLPHSSSNQAMQRTAGRFGIPLSMTSTLYLPERAPPPAVADLVSRWAADYGEKLCRMVVSRA